MLSVSGIAILPLPIVSNSTAEYGEPTGALVDRLRR